MPLAYTPDEVRELHKNLDEIWAWVRKRRYKHLGSVMLELANSVLTTALSGDQGPHHMMRFNEWAMRKELPYRMRANGGTERTGETPVNWIGHEPLRDDGLTQRIMGLLADLLVEQMGELPDAVLILRLNGTCRTLFAANPDSMQAGDPRAAMDEVLESAVRQNRMLRRQAKEARDQ